MATSRRAVLRIAAVGGTLAALLALGLALYLGLLGWQEPDDEGPEPSARRQIPGIREEAAKAGITFQMKFLPSEQGETFRGTLYDHGCGVAIADVDGDGDDDLYFTNQLGRNALYHNNGDGTFSDVTGKAGVGVGDRI